MSFNFTAHELTIEADVRAVEGRVAEFASRGLGLHIAFVYIRCCVIQGERVVETCLPTLSRGATAATRARCPAHCLFVVVDELRGSQ